MHDYYGLYAIILLQKPNLTRKRLGLYHDAIIIAIFAIYARLSALFVSQAIMRIILFEMNYCEYFFRANLNDYGALSHYYSIARVIFCLTVIMIMFFYSYY